MTGYFEEYQERIEQLETDNANLIDKLERLNILASDRGQEIQRLQDLLRRNGIEYERQRASRYGLRRFPDHKEY